jgi:stage III sporulation protein AB
LRKYLTFIKMKAYGGDRMLWLKLTGCGLILFASTGVGFVYSDKFRKRVSELNELLRCLNQLQNEILFTFTPLAEAFLNISQKSKVPIKNIFENMSHSLNSNKVNSVYDAIKLAIEENKYELNLKKEDIEIFLDLGKTIGESDIQGQKSIFNLVIENIKKQIKDAEDVMRKNVKLFRYLGFTMGAMLVILLV